MPSKVKPCPIALVVCDNVYREHGGKTALVGLFNQINAKTFPAIHPRLCVYASVTDIRSDVQLKVDIVHAETDHQVASMGGPPPPNTDQTTICDLTLLFEGLKFPEPGRYYIRFWSNEHLLLQRPFEVQAAGG